MRNSLKVNSIANDELFMASKPGKAFATSPLNFVDVGARGGTHTIINPIAKFCDVVGFEPDEAECKRLAASYEQNKEWNSIKFIPSAVYNSSGEENMFLVNEPNNSSLLEPNEDFTKRYNMVKWQVVGNAKLKTDTLDNLLKLHGQENSGEFIKLDTQGTEYEILEGAKKTLRDNCVAVICEVSFCQLYKNQKLFSEVEMFLRNSGFSFYGFTALRQRSKKLLDKHHNITAERLIYGDALFLRDPLESWSGKSNERNVYIVFIVALLLGFFDFALELAQETWLKDSDEAENVRIANLIKKLSYKSPEEALKEGNEFYQELNDNPQRANVIIGSFVDRRNNCDYDDVLNVSPLPI